MASSKGTAKITYYKPGTQPPIYVAGTFSSPPWIAHEMDYTTDNDGEHTFVREVTGEPGSKIQFKFRIGPGDWWVLHEGLPTVEDSAGNLNHELELQALAEPPELDFSGSGGQKASKSADYDDPISPKTVLGGPAKLQAAPNSGTATPTYAKVAAEVADSAALLNKEEPETPVPDDVAGKIGYRRLSSTPITEVANTAAEVADTAQELDSAGPTIENQVVPGFEGPGRDEDSFDDGEVSRHRASLFSHEAIGMFDDDQEVQEHTLPPEPHPESDAIQEDTEVDLDDIDINDPTLERFPSNRDEIINTVRKISTSLGEDQPVFDGSPTAPAVPVGRRGTADEAPDLLAPVPVSPVVPHPAARLGGSIISAHSSMEAIAEAEEPNAADDTKISPVVLVSTPQERPHFKPTSSDEDEGVVIKDHLVPGTPKSDKFRLPTPEVDVSPRTGPRNVTPDPQSETLSPVQNGKSPGISGQSGDEETNRPTSVTDDSVENASQVDGHALTTGRDTGVGDSGQVRKRAAPGSEQVTSENSGPPTSSTPKHEDGWFKAFFRILFVDWIGGLIRLCGGKRKTLFTAGVIFVGVGWWRFANGQSAVE